MRLKVHAFSGESEQEALIRLCFFTGPLDGPVEIEIRRGDADA